MSNDSAGRDEIRKAIDDVAHNAMRYAQNPDEHTSRRLTAAKEKVLATLSRQSAQREEAIDVGGCAPPVIAAPTETVPRAELEQYRKDAEMYRWLRGAIRQHPTDNAGVDINAWNGHDDFAPIYGPKLDAFIEREMQDGK